MYVVCRRDASVNDAVTLSSVDINQSSIAFRDFLSAVHIAVLDYESSRISRKQ